MPFETKTFEVRDEGTHISVMATMIIATEAPESYQLRRGGFGVGKRYIILTSLVDMETHWDHFDWKYKRTMPTAHQEMERDWDNLKSGDVIDVQFILGETTEKKISERVLDDEMRQRFRRARNDK